MASPPPLSKRAADERWLTLDVSGKLRSGDSVRAFSSVTARTKRDTDTGEIEVTTRAVTQGDTSVTFLCTGGTAGNSYIVSCRYSAETKQTDGTYANSEPLLESLVEVKVV